MLHRRLAIVFLVLFLGACASEHSGPDAPESAETTENHADVVSLSCDPDNGGIALPNGFCAIVVAHEIGRARHLWVHDNGDIYVALRSSEGAGGVVALRDTDGDGRADVREQFGDHYGTAIEIHDGYLYFGTNNSILRYEMTPGALVPEGELETFIDGFPEQSTHAVKPFAFNDQGHLFVNVGAPSNACQQEARTKGSPGQNPCPQREWQASIWRFETNRAGQTQKDDGDRYSNGIRNSVAIAWHETSKAVYVMQHGRDQLETLWPEHFDAEYNAENPAEELLKLEDGADFMWPYCYDDAQGQKILAPEYGGDGKKLGDCDIGSRAARHFPWTLGSQRSHFL